MNLKFEGWPRKIIGSLFYSTPSFVHHLKSTGEFKLELQSEKSKFGLEIRWMTLINNRAPLLYYTKLCVSFQSHEWIESGVTVRKRSTRVKIGDFFVPCDLEIWQMTLKTTGHLFYTKSSFMHHFKAMDEFKLKLQSGNAQFGSKSAIFCPM